MTRAEAGAGLDLRGLRTGYEAGTRRPVETIEAIYDRIEARGDDKVWIHRVSRQEAVERARALEQEGRWLPLYGVPFAINDNLDVEGLPTTAACPAFTYVARRTAVVVAKALKAGAILVGKTNMDQFAAGLSGTRSPYGACVNPFDAGCVAGGSASGAAVAVSAGLVSFALATDTGGGVRVPAAFTNVVGLKPTRGLLSCTGVVPACRSLDSVAILGLTCQDTATVAEVVSGYDASDAWSRTDAGRVPFRSAPPERFRVGVPHREEWAFFGNGEGMRSYEAAIEQFRAMGGEVVPVRYEPFREAGRLLQQGPWLAERLSAIKTLLRTQPGSLDPATRVYIEGAYRYSAIDVFEGFHRLRELERRTQAEWERMDALLLPTAPRVPSLQEAAADPVAIGEQLGYYTQFASLLDLCAIAAPAGFGERGLPWGIQLIGGSCQDGLIEALADRFQQRLGLAPGAAARLAVRG